ncbi:MAG: LacI family DNA-binding transcriptional regulator [Bifidobacteriaceae bacterium]|jgi:LacI family transcriptional regulator|nr:LacI family DNA-binding transcriptional regulator [Bifidobacteriaceae bacterium]
MTSSTVTIAEVADLAGVSVATVSKVLNHRWGVAAATRETVERALMASGYAKSNRPIATNIIDLLISEMDSQWALTLIKGVNAEASRLDYDVIITAAIDTDAAEATWLQRLRKRGSDGVIFALRELGQSTRDALAGRGLPVVLVDPVGTAAGETPTVCATNWAGGLAATEHLISLGHSRIGIITGPDNEICSVDRMDGYVAALRRAGLAMDPELVRHGNFLLDGGIRFGGELLDLPDRPSAIFASSDEQAYGVYEAARARGLTIPDDLSVVGFDDVNLCRWVSPQMTTVHQPLEEMGSMAVRRVVSQAEGAKTGGRLELPTELIIRASTAPPAK